MDLVEAIEFLVEDVGELRVIFTVILTKYQHITCHLVKNENAGPTFNVSANTFTKVI